MGKDSAEDVSVYMQRLMNYLYSLYTNLRFYLRKIFIFMIDLLGFVRLFQLIHRNKIIILLIHGVMDEQDNTLWQPLRPRLSPGNLEKYLQVISRYYHFVSLMEAVEMLSGRKPVKPYSMVLTFDDGYRNNLTHALPVLQRYNAKATFFVSTGFLNNPRPFWWDYALQHTAINGREVKIGSVAIRLNSSNREALLKTYHTDNRFQMSDLEFVREFEQISAALEQESGHSLAEVQNEDDWSAILTWNEIAKNVSGDLIFGSHTVDHIRLENVDNKVAYDQLINSKHDIEAHTNRSCLSLCYPYGSFNDEIINMAKQCGYVCGVTAKEGLNRIGDDLMKLRRITLPNDIEDKNILMQISGFSAAGHNMKRRLMKLFKTF
jgi:peptidoglycan/xylan/chitin deacetylase (PgdA/CDA1 family)